MAVYQVYGYYILWFEAPYLLNYTIIKRWSQDFDQYSKGEEVHDFDIYNQDYILLYTGTNQTLVLEIEMQIYFAYRMTLPLYPAYEDYTYFASNGIVVRSL